MADERNIELLDDYLTNRMSSEDRSAFEQKLKADPDLQHEYSLQKRVIDGIKEARIAELKSMLNKVPVPSAGTGNTLAGKIIFGTVVSLMIAAAALWYFREEEIQVPEQKASSEQQSPAQKPAEPSVEPETNTAVQESVAIEQQGIEADKNQTSAGTEQSKPSLAKRPAPLAAPGAKKSADTGGTTPASSPGEENDKNANQPAETTGHSALMVETETANRDYSFHYQFRDGKLLLFGPFERGSYDVLELTSGDKSGAFLFYKEHYYHLSEADAQIKPLTPITDPALIQKLEDRRKTN